MNTISAEALAVIDALLAPHRRGEVPGYVVGVALNGHTVYRQATGLASLEFGVINTPATRMRIASVTKQFTGLAVMLLVDDGKVDIDRPVRDYLPELTGVNGIPTLRQLLNHTAGLRDGLESAAFFLTEGLFPQIPAGLTHAWSSRFTDVNFAPGEGWGYSNYNYMLLSMVIEKVSGQSLETFCQQRLFAPLGMVDTVMFRNDMELLPGLAASHLRKPDGRYVRGIYPSEELVGGGGIVSTVNDMLRWAANLREHRLGSADSWAQMLGVQHFNNGSTYNYGFGIKHQLHRGTPLLWHDGSTFGSKSALLSYPEHALDVVVLSNRSDSEASAMAIKIAEAVLGDRLGPPKVNAAVTGREALIGHYHSPAARRAFSVQPHQGNLLFVINAAPEGVLSEDGDGLFGDSSAGPLRVYPAATADEIDVEICGRRETYQRLPAQPPAVGDLAAELAGRYRLADFDVPVEIKYQQDTLVLDLCSRYHPCTLRLTPVSTDVLLVTATLFGASGQGTVVVQRQDGVVTGFLFSLQRILNLRFLREDAGA